MKFLKPAVLMAAMIVLGSIPALAQESEVKVIDEVIAVVNDGVITLSSVKREVKGLVEMKVQEGTKREDAQKMIDERRGEMIANMINEELILQKAKELGLEQEIEASLNSRLNQIMKQYNLKTMDALYDEMRRQGVDPEELREAWRRQATREEVVRREVQSKLYWEPTGAKLKEYYEKNKAKFAKPETVTVSEIFLNFAGRDPEAVKARAKQILAQLRSGADFAKMVMDTSESQDVATTKGSMGTITVPDLEQRFPAFAAAIKGLKAGSYAEPVADDIGVHILRIDERTAASSESQFDETAVRMALMQEGFAEAQKKFMAKLREDSYIKISENYRPLVSPLLFAEERKAKPGS